MDRRELMQGAGAVALAALGSMAFAAEHDHHEHHGTGANQPLIEAAGNCVEKGEVCLAHCLVLLGDGDKEMAACSKSVNQMLAICSALQKLAIQNSKYTAALAKVALDSCADCEKECRKHEDKHAECKACAEACAACGKQCKALAA
jgi:Cys-rich four helix bundle protein (predicted Tat secretion target)